MESFEARVGEGHPDAEFLTQYASYSAITNLQTNLNRIGHF
ncbi:MAG: hypothetical protein ACPGVU_26310 [Limisphaerales bacterium]